MGKHSSDEFYKTFEGRFSKDFDIDKDLQKFGVVNQTTMLASDTQAIADYLKGIMIKKYDLDPNNCESHFADTRDTLCYATNDNQTAVSNLLKHPAHFAIVIGGRKSSNSSHLLNFVRKNYPLTLYNQKKIFLQVQH